MSTKAEIESFLHSDPSKYFDLESAWPPYADIPRGLSDVLQYSPDLVTYRADSYKAKLNLIEKNNSFYAWLDLEGTWRNFDAHLYINKSVLFEYDPGRGGGSLVNKGKIPIGTKGSFITEYRIFKILDRSGSESWVDIIQWEDNSAPRVPGQVFLTSWRW